jgi:hypothetical protein
MALMERLNRRAAQAEPRACRNWNEDFSKIMAEAARTWRLEGFAPHDDFGRTFKGDAIAYSDFDSN